MNTPYNKNRGKGEDGPSGFVVNPIGDGSPITTAERDALAELDKGIDLAHSPWLQAVIDGEHGKHPSRPKIFHAFQTHLQELTVQPQRNFESERRAVLVAFSVLRWRETRPATEEVTLRDMWLFYRSHEAYVGPFNKLQPGVAAPHVTGAAWMSRFAIGWELGYEGDAAERWFVTNPLIAGLERLDLPVDSIYEVQEAPAEGFVEIGGVKAIAVRTLLPS